MQHTPVLRDELVGAVATDPDGTYVDATFGRGGHARALLARLSANSRLLVIDRDPRAVAEARRLAESDARVLPAHARFGELTAVLSAHEMTDLTGVMMDVGVSSPQLDDSSRGFSFRGNGPLDMRMDPTSGVTAAQWLQDVPVAELTRVLFEFGEEKNARAIARAIVDARPVHTTDELVAAIDAASVRPDPRKHSATRVFQAIRVHLNDELGELAAGLEAAFEHLEQRGRLAVLTFHSLEHGLVRRRFRQWVRPEVPRRLPIRGEPKGRARYVLKGARPQRAEVDANPRSRSALLQVIERIG